MNFVRLVVHKVHAFQMRYEARKYSASFARRMRNRNWEVATHE